MTRCNEQRRLSDAELDKLEAFARKHNPLPAEALLIERMRQKLAENSSKKRSFLGCDLQFLSMRLTQEKKELVQTVQMGGTIADVWREAADVANIAAMIDLNYEIEQRAATSDKCVECGVNQIEDGRKHLCAGCSVLLSEAEQIPGDEDMGP